LHEIEAAGGFFVHWLPVADEDAPDLDTATDAITWLELNSRWSHGYSGQ
jgi:hypothetical protein